MANADICAALPVVVRRAYGELDRSQVITALYSLTQRVGVQRVTMRALANELGVAVPSVYYYVPGKQAALDLLAESVLAEIPLPEQGPWDVRLTEMYCTARDVLLLVPGVASLLETNRGGEHARRLDRRGRSLLAGAGLTKSAAGVAHTVLYTYLLGSVNLEESLVVNGRVRGNRQAAERFRAGLDVIIAGIRASAVW